MDQLDQLDQLEASELEYNSEDNLYSDIESDSSLGADISPPQSRSPSPTPTLSLNILLSEPSTTNLKHTIGARIQALTLLEFGVPHFQIIAITKISKSQIYRLKEKALLRGYNPSISKIIEIYHIDDSSRSGRPKAS